MFLFAQNYLAEFFLRLCLFIHSSLCGEEVVRCACDIVHMRRSQDNYCEPVLSFQRVASWDRTPSIRFGSKLLYPLGYLSGPRMVSVVQGH